MKLAGTRGLGQRRTPAGWLLLARELLLRHAPRGSERDAAADELLRLARLLRTLPDERQ